MKNEEQKYCPLISDLCYREECAWWIKDRGCVLVMYMAKGMVSIKIRDEEV